MLTYTVVVLNMLYSMFTGKETALLSFFGETANNFEHAFAAIINAITSFWFVNR